MYRNTFTLIKLFGPPLVRFGLPQPKWQMYQGARLPKKTLQPQEAGHSFLYTSFDWQIPFCQCSAPLFGGPFARTHSVPEVFVHLPGEQIYGIAFSCSSLLLLHIWNVHNNSHSWGRKTVVSATRRLRGQWQQREPGQDRKDREVRPRTNLRQK